MPHTARIWCSLYAWHTAQLIHDSLFFLNSLDCKWICSVFFSVFFLFISSLRHTRVQIFWPLHFIGLMRRINIQMCGSDVLGWVSSYVLASTSKLLLSLLSSLVPHFHIHFFNSCSCSSWPSCHFHTIFFFLFRERLDGQQMTSPAGCGANDGRLTANAVRQRRLLRKRQLDVDATSAFMEWNPGLILVHYIVSMGYGNWAMGILDREMGKGQSVHSTIALFSFSFPAADTSYLQVRWNEMQDHCRLFLPHGDVRVNPK